jgi:hypothetical protein
MNKMKNKLSKNCQKVVKKLSKSCQKVVKKLSKSCHKVVKKMKKLTKGSAWYHWSFYVSREAMLKEKKKTFGVTDMSKCQNVSHLFPFSIGEFGYLLHFLFFLCQSVTLWHSVTHVMGDTLASWVTLVTIINEMGTSLEGPINLKTFSVTNISKCHMMSQCDTSYSFLS